MIIGHKQQQKKLRTLFEREQVPHAFLFSGPEGVGKKTVASWFLRMINCTGESFPCNKCRSCYEIQESIHPDIMEINPEKKGIILEQIERVIEKNSLKGIKANFKGVIIESAHLMNTQSQNALLKTLEEPSGNTIIILVSEYPHALLPTILSRSFEVKFSLVHEKEMRKEIKDKEAVTLSLGRPGRAVNYFKFPEKKEIARKAKKETEEMFESDISFRFSLIKKIVDEEREEDFLNCWLRIMEEKMLYQMKKKGDAKIYCEVIKEIERAVLLYSKTNTNTRLMMEKIAIKI